MTTLQPSLEGTTFTHSGYTVLVHDTEEDETGYWAEVLELPGCCTQGETLDEIKVNIQDAIECMLEYADGFSVPEDVVAP